jgi:hypothetical protein
MPRMSVEQAGKPPRAAQTRRSARELGRRAAHAGALLSCLLTISGTLDALSGSASAAGPYWHLDARAIPTDLQPGGEGHILVTLANLSDTTVPGSAVTITDQLPLQLTATAISTHSFASGHNLFNQEEGLTCLSSPTAPSCTWTEPVTSYGIIEMDITVKVNEPPGTVTTLPNEAKVEGGEVPSAATRDPLTVNATQAPFGFERYELALENEDGSTDAQAGSHPFQLTTGLDLNTTVESGVARPAALPKDLHVNLPTGLVGDPAATPRCGSLEFAAVSNFIDRCPPDTVVGIAAVTVTGLSIPGERKPFTMPEPVFNLTPAPGEPARFGFLAIVVPVVLDTRVRSGGDYGVTVSSDNILQTAGLISSLVTVWGVPGDSRHDASRGWPCLYPGSVGTCVASEQLQPRPFLTVPTACGRPLESSVEVDSWPFPGQVSQEAPPLAGKAMALSGCNRLPFDPSLTVQPEAHAASTPTGLNVDLRLPQETTLSASGLAEADLKTTSVTLPQGIQVSPSSASGLEACSEAEIGFQGTDASSTDLFSSTLPEPFCPNGAKIGVAHVKTPLLAHELEGGVYVAAQNANPFGSLLALYIVAQDPVSGVLVKLAGEVHLDEQSGQVVSTFRNTPQVPFEELRLEFFGGARGSLSTPPLCGSYETKALLAPWSGHPPTQSSSSFPITSGPNRSACADPLPFAPSLTAGSTNAQADAFSPFTMTMSREDGDQSLGAVQLHMPEGLLGRLASVTPCSELRASEGTCGPESEIGHVVANVGLGSDPYTISGGKVFVTGPYNGAPYGLSIAEPAKAGPFDLGSGPCDCVVVRSKIEIDPHTSALTITSDPLPTMLDGIPLQLKQVNVTIDRPGFTFNPTNCSQLAITATITSEDGATAPLSMPFEVANCATLPFKPTFTVLTLAKTSKANGASLHVKVTSGPGEANIDKVKVDLPKQLPSRLTTLQKACSDATFNANPASCPGGSVVGAATAVTPVLKSPLTGPAYLVSHAGAAFPDLVIVLQGEGITLQLIGNTDIKKGITISTFNAVPDAPISTFDLVLPEGPHSALAAHGNLCKSKLNMPTAITGQNGAEIKQTTRIAVAGCPKHKKARRAKTHRLRGRAKR